MLLFYQLMRFGIVGVCAAIVHLSVVTSLVEFARFQPLYANIFGFSCAFNVSYFGHRLFTFRGTQVTHRSAWLRLLFVSISLFFANEGLFYFFLSLHIPYFIALLCVIVTMPLITFTINKLWVFRH